MLVYFKAATATERYVVHTVIDYFCSTLASEQAANNGLLMNLRLVSARWLGNLANADASVVVDEIGCATTRKV